MEQKALIRTVEPDGTAKVLVIRESACSGDCHKCTGCGAAKERILFEAVNAIGAKPGDLVNIHAESGPVLAGAAVLYMVPLILFFLGYFLGDLAGQGTLGGCLGFVLGIAAAALYDRKVAAKRKTVYTITGYVRKKGDPHID